MQGAATAAVTLVEYGDYQCPYCGAAYPLVKELQRQFADDLRFVFRNFPLTQAHPLAQMAAELAEAAAAQDKFWPMHDWIYQNQEQWSAGGADELLNSSGVPGRRVMVRRLPSASRRISEAACAVVSMALRASLSTAGYTWAPRVHLRRQSNGSSAAERRCDEVLKSSKGNDESDSFRAHT